MTPDVTRTNKRLSLGRPIQAKGLQLTHAWYDNRRIVFCTDVENDPIQRNHRKGKFYEISELETIKQEFEEGSTFVDIGANVGNHSIFAAAFMNADRVIPIEPNPRAYRLLIQNVLLNKLEQVVDLTKLGVGLSDQLSSGFSVEKRKRNIGAAKLIENGGGSLRVFPADDLLADVDPGFVKIDTEGMEMRVLTGLKRTIERCAPKMMVEVDTENDDEFQTWLKASGYTVKSVNQRYKRNRNYLIVSSRQ